MEIYDPAKGLAVADGDESLAVELLQVFRDTKGRLIAELNEAIDDHHADRLRRAAHTLKGSLANLGAPTAAHQARAIEKMGADSKFDEARSAYANLVSEVDRFLSVALTYYNISTVTEEVPR
jgi:HPt (histidine-containing phosphotransfer) domain-containing protein